MQYSALTQKIQGDTVDAWALHSRAKEADRNGQDVILLSIGDPDFATPAAISQAAINALTDGDTHYSAIVGRDSLRDVIAREHQQNSGQITTRDNVIVLAGAQNSLFATSQCITGSDDEVIVLQPMYITYEACIQATGAKLVPVLLDAGTGFRLDAAALEAAVTARSRAIYFATPNNPTGVIMNRDELQAIAACAIKHDLWVVSDEVYSELTFDAEHLSIAGLPGMAERTVTINSLSKSHAMTGWRIGWAIGPEALVSHMHNLALCMLYGLPGFIQQAGLYALTEAKHETANMRRIYRQRRDLLVAELRDIELFDFLVPQAAMYLMLDVRRTGMTAGDFANALYEETGVATLDASTFGKSAEGFVRISFTLSGSQLREACRRIKQFMQRFKNGIADQSIGKPA